MKIFAVVMICGCTAVAAAQQPKVANAQVSVREHASLASEVAASKAPKWIGYSVATLREMHLGWYEGKEYLEGRPKGDDDEKHEDGTAQRSAVILLRAGDGKIERVRLTDPSRELDGGGLPFVWLNGVSQAESLKLLAGLVEANTVSLEILGRPSDRDRRAANLRESGLFAISVHEAPEGTSVLRGFTDAKYPRPLREKAAFWLANQRGREGFEAVSALLKQPGDDAFREQLVFDLTLVKDPVKKAAVDQLLDVAKNDASTKVRSKAQFWLAQVVAHKGVEDSRIARSLGESASGDPDAAIRKSAVFALSRLPQEQATHELIQVASTTKDVSTRREAIFWLGQSKDPQALAYLEKVVRE